jgi:hypothetical protein
VDRALDCVALMTEGFNRVDAAPCIALTAVAVAAAQRRSHRAA